MLLAATSLRPVLAISGPLRELLQGLEEFKCLRARSYRGAQGFSQPENRALVTHCGSLPQVGACHKPDGTLS